MWAGRLPNGPKNSPAQRRAILAKMVGLGTPNLPPLHPPHRALHCALWGETRGRDRLREGVKMARARGNQSFFVVETAVSATTVEGPPQGAQGACRKSSKVGSRIHENRRDVVGLFKAWGNKRTAKQLPEAQTQLYLRTLFNLCLVPPRGVRGRVRTIIFPRQSVILGRIPTGSGG